MKNEKFYQSYVHAINGLKIGVKEERNFRKELILGTLTLAVSAWLGLDQVEWLFIILCIAFVLGAELTNSALERIVDYVSPEFHEFAKASKDLAAGAVLLSAMGSAVIGLVIFVPKILHLLIG